LWAFGELSAHTFLEVLGVYVESYHFSAFRAGDEINKALIYGLFFGAFVLFFLTGTSVNGVTFGEDVKITKSTQN